MVQIVGLNSEYHQQVFDLIKTYSDDFVMLPKSIEEIKNLSPHFRLLVEHEQVQACVMLDQFTETLAEVKSLAVSKAMQKQGLGRALVLDCEQRAKELGIKKIFALTFSTDFFHKLGYKIVDKETLPEKVYRECVRCHYYDNCKEIAMIKELS